MLSQRDGPVTLKLGRYDGAWRPHPSTDRYAPGINGPAEKVTYTPTGNGQVSVDVERRNGPWAFAPPREHSVGPMPTAASVARSHAAHKYVWGALLVYLAAMACGFELGYGPIGGGSLIGGFVGLVLGFFVAYVINLSAVVALHTHQTRARRAQDTVVPHR
ncbi:MAG TPA: hypothetical protein VFN80_07050 [Acidothermaceae bacterium]|nr:hypothetical protein [Acidothermaceae bacterium]